MDATADRERVSWYAMCAGEALSGLGASPAGLDAEEARRRLAEHGYNELTVQKRSALLRLLLQFHNAMIYILLAAACVTGFLLHELVDTVVILGVVVLNVIIGFVQEGKAEAAIEALKKMIVAESAVLRDGRKQVIATRELVPGDVVLLEGGSRVPADLRLLQARNLYADEAPLTGESVPVSKHTEAIGKERLGPGDQRNMAFSGTFITRGTGQGVVTSTGRQTEFGRVAVLMQETPRIITPLTRKIDEFTRFLIIAILLIAAASFGLGVAFDFPVGYSFLAAVALAVAAIPEMLPAIVIAILALASTAMARRSALIRKLPAAETLGCASVICSDKTGTLTRNEMTVVRLFSGGRRYRVTGAGYEPLGEFLRDGEVVDLALEPPELMELLRAASWCNDTVLAEAEDMAHEALRVLGKACKRVPKTHTRLTPDDLRGLTFLGLSGMIDPPRVEVIDAVRQCKDAGIRVVMITGDHAATARAIACEIGIIGAGDEVLTGGARSSP